MLLRIGKREATKISQRRPVKEAFDKLVLPRPKIRGLSLEERGLSLCCIKYVLVALGIDENVEFLVVLHLMQILTEPYQCSLAELLVGKYDTSHGRLLVSHATGFVSHASSYLAWDDLSALEKFEDSKEANTGDEYCLLCRCFLCQSKRSYGKD
jgi:hypothetical protein